jgi:predicted metal-dependent phosphoesterase TrpH
LIDLHLHTTASDGRCTPAELVTRARAAGLTTISVTDHDTTAGLEETRAAAPDLRLVPGIEITAVDGGRDVHILGYFIDRQSQAFAAFLQRQRVLRVERVREIARRLAALDAPVDVNRILVPAASHPGRSVGRPLVARALVDAGHVATVQEAFDRFLAVGQPAFVPRRGRSAARVVQVIHDAGGVAAFAHPGITRRDDLIERLVADGLDALEVFHGEHDPDTSARYLAMARRLGLGVSGGSDFHGDIEGGCGRRALGSVRLDPDHLLDLEARAARRRAASTV